MRIMPVWDERMRYLRNWYHQLGTFPETRHPHHQRSKDDNQSFTADAYTVYNMRRSAGWHIHCNYHISSAAPANRSLQHHYKITTVLVGGRTQNVSYIFQGVFEGGLEHVSLHFEGILKTLPTKTTPGARSATNFTFKGGGGVPKNVSYILVWSPLKSTLKGVMIL